MLGQLARLGIAAGMLATQASAGEPGFPYKAYITTDNVLVRSGPGENYYATEKLTTGDEVEVYRHDPGGWLAIRPPRGSFSWVRTHSMQTTRDGLALAAEDRVAVRVGSNLSDNRDVIQVRLKQGETVELFDPPRGITIRPDDPWFRVSPPAGEFRWVSGKCVDASFPKDGIGRTPIDLSGRAGIWPGAGGSSAGQRALTAIDLELSAMVAQPTSEWDFTDLRNRTQVLFDRATAPLDRGRTRAVLERIARFEDIRRRETALTAEQPAQPDLPQHSNMPPSTIGPSQGDGRYDAVGQLAHVPAPSPGGPQYAILDSSGNVRCYVSPATGVNLMSYVGRNVGITGYRGYIPEKRAAHIMARHVSVVDGSITR